MSEGQQGNRTVFIVLAAVGVVLIVAVGIVGILAALGIAGFRGYLARAKGAEGKSEVARLARSVAMCAESGAATGTPGAASLPSSAPAVPPSLRDVSGRKYLSSPSEWSAPAYSCGAFSLSMPQYFQYEWTLVSPTTGKAVARADLNGDGAVDQEFSVVVTCSGASCTVGSPSGP